MTAEILHEAANALRVDASVGYQRGHISMREVRFKRAVADLLDEAANGIEVMAPLDWDYPMGPMDCTGSLRPEFRGALNVASVYLGESS